MNENGAEHGEERLVELLVEYDEALARDAPTERIEDTAAGLEPELTAEWAAAKSCLDLLERMRHEGTLQQALPQHASATSTTQSPTQRRVGRFVLEHELGRGGLGIVYLAHDPQLGRKVALKIPRFEALLEDDLRQRFLFEAEAAARLNHPHIVALYEVDEEGSLCYLAAEYCAGPTLAEWLRTRSQPVRFHIAAKVVSQLADAVDHAHSRGVLHRDIKPSNVLLVVQNENGSNDSPGLPKLTDFGMAKLLEQGGDARTRTGAILGTLAYMAPEQIEGRIRDLDVRTDVYALGAILYELVTGRAPYSGATDVDLLRQIATGEPTAPRRLRPDVPRDLEAITLKCLAKQPDARYASARALADDLQHFLEGKPTVARPLGVAGRVVKWVRRRPAVTALALVSILSIMSLAGFNAWRIQEARRSQAESSRLRKLADVEHDRAAGEEALSRRVQYASRMRKAQQAWRDGNLQLLQGILAEYAEGTSDANLRHFEWYHLNYLAHLPHRVLRGHEGEVYGVAYAPDGRTIVTCGRDGTVRLWDAEAGAMRAVLREHTTCVNSVDFSPDGDTFVTASCDKTIKLWSFSQQKVLATLTGHSEKVVAAVFLDDGKLLLSISLNLEGQDGRREAWLWNTATRKLRTDWPPAGETIQGIAAGRSGQTLVTFADNQIAVWKRQGDSWELNHRCSNVPTVPGGYVTPDEEFMLVPRGRLLQMIRLRDGAVVNQSTDHTGGVNGIGASSALDHFATACGDSAVRVFDYPSGKLVHRLLGHGPGTWQVAWSPNTNSLASVGRDGTLRLWDLQVGTERIHLSLPAERDLAATGKVRDIAYLQDGRHVNATYDGFTVVWNLPTGQVVPLVQLPGPRLVDSPPASQADPSFPVLSHALLPQWDDRACYMPARLELLPDFDLPLKSISCARLIGDGTQIAEIKAGNLRIWNRFPLQLISEQRVDGLPPIILDLSPDGSRLCGASTDEQVEIYDLRTRTQISLGKVHGFRNACFSPDGHAVFIQADGAFEYDASSGKLRRDYPRGKVTGCGYSADGQRLAVSSELGFITIYDATTGEETLRLDDQASGIVFASDGTSLVTNDVSDRRLTYWPGKK